MGHPVVPKNSILKFQDVNSTSYVRFVPIVFQCKHFSTGAIIFSLFEELKDKMSDPSQVCIICDSIAPPNKEFQCHYGQARCCLKCKAFFRRAVQGKRYHQTLLEMYRVWLIVI